MADKERLTGTSGFIECHADVHQFFPVDSSGKAYASCEHCDYYRFASKRCGLTNEVCFSPAKYVGDKCPFMDDLLAYFND